MTTADRRALFLILGVVAALYLPQLGAPFEYDDKVEILQNRVLRAPLDLRAMWDYNPFRVLLLGTFAWDLWAWGIGNPWAWRLENTAIHATNTALVMAMAAALVARAAPHWESARRDLLVWGSALVFAVHPLAIEAITYISGRSSSLATLFVLASITAWLRYVDRIEAAPDAARWLQARIRRLNAGLAIALCAGLTVGLPVAWMVAHERLSPARGLGFGLAGAGALLGAAAVVLAPRWRALTPPEPSASVRFEGRAASNLLVISFVAFVLGTITKEIAATLPAVLLLIEAVIVHRGDLRGAARALRGRLFPFFAIPAFLLVLRWVAYGYVASPTFIRPWTTNLLTQLEVLVQYLRLWVIPFPQSIYHHWPVVSPPGSSLTWASAAVLTALLGAALVSRRRAPLFSLGILVAAVTIAPTSSVFALKETMVEHRTYLPSIGLALATAALVAGPLWALAVRVGRARPVWHAAAPLLLWCGGLAAENVAYHQLWRSEEVLWRTALAVNPAAADAWRYLGDLYAGQGRWDDAERVLETGVLHAPNDPSLLSKLGRVHAIGQRFDEATRWFERALAMDSCHTPALNNLAHIKRLRGDIAGAVDLFSASLACEAEENYVAHRGLSDIYYSDARDREKAGHHTTRALEALDPLSPEAPALKARLMELTW